MILNEKFKDDKSRRAFFARLRKNMQRQTVHPPGRDPVASDWLGRRKDGGINTYGAFGQPENRGDKVKGWSKGKGGADTEKLIGRLDKVRHSGIRENPNMKLPRKVSDGPSDGSMKGTRTSGKTAVFRSASETPKISEKSSQIPKSSFDVAFQNAIDKKKAAIPPVSSPDELTQRESNLRNDIASALRKTRRQMRTEVEGNPERETIGSVVSRMRKSRNPSKVADRPVRRRLRPDEIDSTLHTRSRSLNVAIGKNRKIEGVYVAPRIPKLS
jgi:hypothetical protein